MPTRIRRWRSRNHVSSWEGWLTYDAIQTADELKKPTFLVHSETAAIPQGAREYARRMGRNITELWLENVTQFDFYDDPGAVKTASDAVADHFGQTLR